MTKRSKRKRSSTKTRAKAKPRKVGASKRSARRVGATRKRTRAKRLHTTAKRVRKARRKRGVLHACDAYIFGPDLATEASAAGRSIDDLNLVSYARNAAEALLEAHPDVVFTSGRRTVKEQADAMAGNVLRNRKWIEQTYVNTPERNALQRWVDDNRAATTKSAISAGLGGIMNGWTDAQKGRLSRHFSGQAFDVRPVAQGAAIKRTIRSLPSLRRFLQSEGGLTIWHADFKTA
jgi:hypothetical protein